MKNSIDQNEKLEKLNSKKIKRLIKAELLSQLCRHHRYKYEVNGFIYVEIYKINYERI